MELTDTSYLFVDESGVLSGPLHVAVDVTNKCNAKCLHCYNRSGGLLERNELTDQELLSMFEDVANMKPFSVCFCGGEPMLRYETLLNVTKMLKDAGVSVVSMVSNGWFIGEREAQKLVEFGLSRCQISLDGACAETHERMRGIPGIFDKAIGALDALDKHGIPLQVAFSPTRFNIEEFPALIDLLTKYKNLTEVRVQPLMPMGNAMLNEGELFVDDQDYRKLVRFIDEVKKKRLCRFEVNWGDPLDHLVRFPNFEFKNNSFVEVKSDGSIALSAYLPIVVGNVRRHKLSEYWKAGIGAAWSLPVAKELASSVVSIGDMKFDDQQFSTTFYEENIEIDFIDDDVLSNSSAFTLSNLYTKRTTND